MTSSCYGAGGAGLDHIVAPGVYSIVFIWLLELLFPWLLNFELLLLKYLGRPLLGVLIFGLLIVLSYQAWKLLMEGGKR